MKRHAVASLIVVTVLLSSALVITPVSASVGKVPYHPAPLKFWKSLEKTLGKLGSDVPDNMLTLLRALKILP